MAILRPHRPFGIVRFSRRRACSTQSWVTFFDLQTLLKGKLLSAKIRRSSFLASADQRGRSSSR
jgi:hypothetical protein